MKVAFYLFILVLTQANSDDNSKYHSNLIECIPHKNPDNNTIEEYAKLQVVTDLTHLPLRDIARRELISEQNAYYNGFLFCSWKKYEYQTKKGVVVYDTIERSLRDALVSEVGSTGPGINLSKIEAKNIVNHCRNITENTPGRTAIKVQNCILKQIQHIGVIN
ncbi:hypothetical protein ILUMI_24603 [Ignelater luminosus]|uniref:Uncharacterized protein n=1 Tax=Ignelater luminosus TaxID=2038154 RepID=A0A8K0CBK9_IGNLU|nr:hypothetical protein ILUMI_24603 [Ignelater luminosus]